VKKLVAVIAPGAMGAAAGARLVENGIDVITSLTGRSAASRARADRAGMRSVEDAEIAAAPVILSIVPPRDAMGLAERLAPALRQTSAKPIYVDCNAVSPRTTERVGAVIAETGAAFVDGGIIGGPPRPGYDGPVLYVSGADARKVEWLAAHGLVVRVVEGGIGAASALKMSYAAITKGLTAIGTVSVLAASEAGAARALLAELSQSQPQLLAYLARSVPDMFPKAYRWVAEMQEIAAFTGRDEGRRIYDGIADLYQGIADDRAGAGHDVAKLAAFFKADT
jgi:3-hydroxyisobutyrate dehydrogenase-like beta-hydroxyacid dehydrogenase